MVPITIFIISPHLMFGSGLESLLGRETALTIVGRAKSVEQAATMLQTLQPSIVILDSDELTRNNLSSVVHILNLNPNSRVIGVSLHNNKAYTYHINEIALNGPADLLQMIAITSPASGFLFKDGAAPKEQVI